MSKPLPPRPDLDQLKKQARELLHAYQAAHPEAVKRLRAHVPRLSEAREEEILQAKFTLQNAQHVVAREYGFAGWTELSAALAPPAEAPSPRSEREIQLLLTQFHKEELALFLWAADAEVQEAVLSQATEYLRDFVEDELEFLGPMAPWFQPGGEMTAPSITSFEDLVKLSDREIQAMLREVDRRDCAAALLQASVAMQEKIFTNVSRRVRMALEKEMATLDVSPEEIARAQAEILETATGCTRHIRDEVRGQIEAVRKCFEQVRQAAEPSLSHSQEMGALRNLLVDCARQSRRDGFVSLRQRDDLPELMEIVLEYISQPEKGTVEEARKTDWILRTLLLITEGTAPGEVEKALKKQ
jgi:hypothetical protein